MVLAAFSRRAPSRSTSTATSSPSMTAATGATTIHSRVLNSVCWNPATSAAPCSCRSPTNAVLSALAKLYTIVWMAG